MILDAALDVINPYTVEKFYLLIAMNMGINY